MKGNVKIGYPVPSNDMWGICMPMSLDLTGLTEVLLTGSLTENVSHFVNTLQEQLSRGTSSSNASMIAIRIIHDETANDARVAKSGMRLSAS